MKVARLTRTDNVYSANAYLVLGTWNHIGDVNTLIDVGTDSFIIGEIDKASTGVGKKAIEQVILTHSHFDHNGGLASVIDRFHPRVYAFSPNDGVDVLLNDGQILPIADQFFQVIHTPGHSSDSICLYCPSEKVLFSGDVPLCIRTSGSSYEEEFVVALEKIARLDIRTIYSGHDAPLKDRANETIAMTLSNVHSSGIAYPASM
jgi:glyoxylase-like metal-dependent hydrolase (beta-lactamase superfamily II)